MPQVIGCSLARRTAYSPFVSMMLKTPLVQCIDSGLRQADSTCPLIAIWNLGFPSTGVPPSASMAQVEYSYYRRLYALLQKATTFLHRTTPLRHYFYIPIQRQWEGHSVPQRAHSNVGRWQSTIEFPRVLRSKQQCIPHAVRRARLEWRNTI